MHTTSKLTRVDITATYNCNSISGLFAHYIYVNCFQMRTDSWSECKACIGVALLPRVRDRLV